MQGNKCLCEEKLFSRIKSPLTSSTTQVSGHYHHPFHYLLKIFLLFFRVRVVESHDQLPSEVHLVVLVQQRGLGVADV